MGLASLGVPGLFRRASVPGGGDRDLPRRGTEAPPYGPRDAAAGRRRSLTQQPDPLRPLHRLGPVTGA